MAKRKNHLWFLFIGSNFLFGIILLAFSFQSVEKQKRLFNLLAKDGNLEIITIEFLNLLKPAFLLFAILFLLFAFWALIWRENSLKALSKIPELPNQLHKHFLQETKILFQALKRSLLNKPLVHSIGALTFIAIAARIPFIARPMLHDEAFTVINYTFLPWKYAIADYSLPNNHILHTALVKLSTQIFGLRPWSTRLPALTAGVLLAPLGYLLTRKHYNQRTALLAGTMIAVFPTLIAYSTNARGYSLLSLFTLLIFLCSTYAMEKKSIIAWTMTSIFSALGFLNLPIMLLPYGACITWLFLIGIRKHFSSQYSRSEYFSALITSIILTIILTGILYMPVMRYSGPDALFLNPYVSPLSWENFPATFLSRMEDTWFDWTHALPLPITILLILGFVSSIVWHKSISNYKSSLQLPIFLFIFCELIIFRPNTWERIWQFLLPLMLIWYAAGLVSIIDKFSKKEQSTSSPILISILIGIVLINTITYTVQHFPDIKPKSGDAEKAVLYLQKVLQDDDIVVITYPDDTTLTYYFNVHQVPKNYLRRDIPFKQAYVMVNHTLYQTPEQVIRERGPDLPFFNLESAEVILTLKEHHLYKIDANWNLIKDAYNLK